MVRCYFYKLVKKDAKKVNYDYLCQEQIGSMKETCLLESCKKIRKHLLLTTTSVWYVIWTALLNSKLLTSIILDTGVVF